MPAPPALVDTVRVRGEIDPRGLHRVADSTTRRRVDLHTGEVVEFTQRARLRLDCGAEVRLVTKGPSTFATVEFSVPTLLWGHNLRAADLDDLTAALRVVIEQSADVLVWVPEPDNLDLLRADLVRDFTGVRHAGQLLERLAFATHQPPAELYQGRNGGIQTLCRGPRSKRWLARGYDKHEQLLDLARAARGAPRQGFLALAEQAREMLRVEIQLRSLVLHEHDVRHVRDLTEERIATLRRRYFHRAGFDRAVGGATSLSVAAQRLTDTGRPSEFGTVLEYLTCEAHGLPYRRSHPTKAKAKRIAKELGLTPADILHPDIEPVRLDYDRGVALRGDEALAR